MEDGFRTMQRQECEFFLVQYVPDPVKNEFVNIGVLLRAAGGTGGGGSALRFTRNWSRVRCVDPDADVSMLEALEGEIRQRIEERPGVGLRPLLSVLEDSFSNQVRLTAAKGCLAENLVTETEQLMRLYVEPRKREAVARRSGRQAIYAAMRREFERAGVWDMMKKRIAIAGYLGRADTLRIDCGYRNGKVRMFHAVSLDDLDVAKVLAFTAAKLAAGVRRVDGTDLVLTAIVEPLQRNGPEGRLEKSGDQLAIYDAGKSTMEESGIQVWATTGLEAMALTARQELGVT